ncbi:MAG: XRE family transcriptional regulator [Chloroflexus sp.]
MINQRLRQLRLARGMTLDELAAATGLLVTRHEISRYEHGQDQPSPIVLQQLAQVLGIRPTDLLSDHHQFQIELITYRKRAVLSKRYQERMVALAQEILQNRLRLQELIGESNRFDVPLFAYSITTLDEAEAAAADLRARWNLGSVPIANLTDTLEDRGLHVIALSPDDELDDIAAIARDETNVAVAAVMFSQRSYDGALWRMNLAHELAYLVLRLDNNKLNSEQAAFRFATALLAPANDLRQYIGEHRNNLHPDELLLLKHHFGMSTQALLDRMRTLGIIKQRLYRQWMIELNQRGWRHTEPEPLPVEEPLWFQRIILRALAEELIDPTEAHRLLGEEVPSFDHTADTKGVCQSLLRQPLVARHTVLAEQAAMAVDLYPASSNVVNEVETSEHS